MERLSIVTGERCDAWKSAIALLRLACVELCGDAWCGSPMGAAMWRRAPEPADGMGVRGAGLGAALLGAADGEKGQNAGARAAARAAAAASRRW